MTHSGCYQTELDCLRNLRELRADGNKIKSVDGLQKLENLVKLSLESNQIRTVDLTGFRWYVRRLMIGDHCADDRLQAKIRNVKPESEPIGRHSGLEYARRIDRLESRYVHTGTRSLPCNPVLPAARSTCIDGLSAISQRFR